MLGFMLSNLIDLVKVTGNRKSGIGNRESGIGNPESGIGNRESGIGNRESETIIVTIYLVFISSYYS